jgi:MOSC domain-containing protein YiiM
LPGLTQQLGVRSLQRVGGGEQFHTGGLVAETVLRRHPCDALREHALSPAGIDYGRRAGIRAQNMVEYQV